MPNLSWNFLLPGSGPHTFLWTGSNAYIDNSIIKMSKHTSPSYTYSFEGVEVRLERKNGTSSMEVVKWKLFVDGRLVEEHALSKDGTRDFKNAQEGSYQIATHFTPIGSPRSIWIFLINITSHTITLCHDHSTGRVELTLDSALVSGRKYKIIDSGIKLRFECEGVEGYVWVKPNLFSFRYECVCNGVGLKPCHTMKQGAIDVEPIDVTKDGIFRGDLASKVPTSKSTVGWNEGDSNLEEEENDTKPLTRKLAEAKFSDSEDDNSRDESKNEVEAKEEGISGIVGGKKSKTVVIPASAAPNQNSFDYANYEPTLPRGVTQEAGGYSAGVTVKGRFLNLGTFDTVEEAAEAYTNGLERYKRK